MLFKKGYTFIEITATLVVVAVMVSLALPSFTIQMNKVINQEAIQILGVIYAKQKEFLKENGRYANNLSELDDIVVATDLKKFDSASFTSSFPVGGVARTTSCNSTNNINYLAGLTRNDMSSPYTLYMREDGTILCTPCSPVGTPSLCTRMGYQPTP